MNVVLGDDGLLRVPHHDGILVGLAYEDGTRLRLTIRCLDGLLTRIDLLGVHDMNLVHICGGTIVMTIRARPVRDLQDADQPWISGLDVAWLAEGHRRYGTPGPGDMVKSAARDRPDAYLVTLSSSFGGELYAVCDRIEVSREPDAAQSQGDL